MLTLMADHSLATEFSASRFPSQGDVGTSLAHQLVRALSTRLCLMDRTITTHSVFSRRTTAPGKAVCRKSACNKSLPLRHDFSPKRIRAHPHQWGANFSSTPRDSMRHRGSSTCYHMSARFQRRHSQGRGHKRLSRCALSLGPQCRSQLWRQVAQAQ